MRKDTECLQLMRTSTYLVRVVPEGDRGIEADLAILLSSWGTCAGSTCPGDLNGDGLVDGADLALILSSWGPCFGCP